MSGAIEGRWDELDAIPREVLARLLNDECLAHVPLFLFQKTAGDVLEERGIRFSRADALEQAGGFTDTAIGEAARETGLVGLVYPGEVVGLDPAKCYVDYRQRITFLEYPKANEGRGGTGVSGSQATLRALMALSGWTNYGMTSGFLPQDGGTIRPRRLVDGDGEVRCCAWDLVLEACFQPEAKVICPRSPDPTMLLSEDSLVIAWSLGAELLVPTNQHHPEQPDLAPYPDGDKSVWFTIDESHPIKGGEATTVVGHEAGPVWQATVAVEPDACFWLRWFCGGPGLTDSDTQGLKIDVASLSSP